MAKAANPDNGLVMNLVQKVQPFKNGLQELSLMILETEQQVIGSVGNVPLITTNVNFFTKSFLISACAHLEMCIKEVVFEIAKEIDSRFSAASIPYALLEWRYSIKKKQESGNRPSFPPSIKMTKKEVDDLVSGNVHKTKEALSIVGVDLAANTEDWEGWKDKIQTLVTRRNNIVHHNDNASDLSLGDINSYVQMILDYIDFIVSVCQSQHPNTPTQ